MLSYQHGYHAGCFADVVKHITLSHILSYMTIKDQPLLYLDTHSGRGLYDLHQHQSQKTGEYRVGIECLWQDRHKLPDTFKPYLNIIKNLNQKDQLRYYPGSPTIALNLLRDCDRAVLCELHPKEYQHLENLANQKKRLFILHSNGMEQLKSLLPPIEKRGLIFIDPSYEVKQEYKTLVHDVKNAYNKFATGVYCIWYPIIDNKLHQPLTRGLATISSKYLNLEFDLNPKTNTGMSGCGLWVINPPHVLNSHMQNVLETLRNYFNPGKSVFRL